MAKSEKIAISLPANLLKAVEAECRKTKETRSGFFRQAVEEHLKRQRDQADIRRYIEGYRRMPETAEEIAMAEATAWEILSAEPWDAKG
jgi:metal-responsive CopG/Arc/MetJ family transcriptional regulator